MGGHLRHLLTTSRKRLTRIPILLVVVLVGSSLAGGRAQSAPPSIADDPVVELPDPTPATPEAVSGSSDSTLEPSISATTAYSTEVFDEEESLSPNGLTVYTSTSAGTFALTGTVINDDTGAGVPSALVTLTPSSGGTSLQAKTDANGAYAFVDVPVSGSSQRYNLSVDGSGFGTYQVNNDDYAANETYVITSELDSSTQIYDESVGAGDSTLGPTIAGASGYPSHTRVPPSIKVRLYSHVNGCQAGNFRRTRNYPWKFYVLHVAVAEINTNWIEKAWKANAAAQQNYAWYHRIQDSPINNTTQYQCFKPHRRVPTRWKRWIGDVNDERLKLGNGNVQQTQYRAGRYDCSESLYPADGNKLSQNGSRARADSNTAACGGDEGWRAIAEYYYTGNVVAGAAPPTPTRSYSVGTSSITFNFNAVVGWRYSLQKHYSECPGGAVGPCWVEIYDKGWDWGSRDIPKSFKYSTSGCHEYRVKAVNPVGSSPYGNYNNGNRICA